MPRPDSAPFPAVSPHMLSGALYMLLAAVFWGGLFPVAKLMLGQVDPFSLTSLRYGITAVLMLALLWRSEGRAALSAAGRQGELLLFGSAGFAGFSLLVFSGLRSSTPAHGAILAALMPLLTAVLQAAISRRLPPLHTLASVALALFGVAMVVSNGHPASVFASASVGSDLLILAGVLCWVIYTLGARRFAGWSPLRYTSLSVLYGLPAIFGCTLLAYAVGLGHWPQSSTLLQLWPQLLYTVVLASVVAVLGWNAGVQRLGPLNGVLFINFVPISAFAIQVAQGHPLGQAELFGGGLVVFALLLNNLMQRGPLNLQGAPRMLADRP